MFALPGTLILVVFCIARPFELFEALRGLPFLHAASGLAVLGYALDIRTGLGEARIVQGVKLAMLWLVWVIIATAVSAPAALSMYVVNLMILFLTYFLVANGIQSYAAFEKVAGAVVLCTFWICIVCIHQSFQPLECVYFDPDSPSLVFPTGESCTEKSDCAVSDEAFRDCSRIGLFGVGSVGERVRYTGILQDPNEVSMLAASSLPMAIAFTELRPTFWRKIGLVIFSLMVVLTVKETQSRGGQLVMAAVVVTYTVKKIGIARAIMLFAPLAVAALALSGGGGREDAEDSTQKRLGCMLAGTEMLLRSPLTGVGYGQFMQYHDQTAHNAYILAAAETGFVGLVLWALVGYCVLRGLYDLRTVHGDDRRAQVWSIALATSLVGMFVGIFFLSFTYHLVLWVFFGLAVSLHACLGPRVPRRITPQEIALLSVGCLLTMVGVYFYASSQI